MKVIEGVASYDDILRLTKELPACDLTGKKEGNSETKRFDGDELIK